MWCSVIPGTGWVRSRRSPSAGATAKTSSKSSPSPRACSSGVRPSFSARRRLADRDGLRAEHRPAAGLLADVLDIGGQAVADVDHGVQIGDLVQAQRLAHARREIEVLAEDAAAERAGHQQPVARLRSAARSPAPRPVASPSTVTEMTSGPSQLLVSPPTIGGVEGVGDLAHAVIQFLRQGSPAAARQPDADHRGHGPAGHGGDVAQVDGHRLAADTPRPGLGQEETAPLQQHVGRDQARPARRPEPAPPRRRPGRPTRAGRPESAAAASRCMRTPSVPSSLLRGRSVIVIIDEMG